MPNLLRLATLQGPTDANLADWLDASGDAESSLSRDGGFVDATVDVQPSSCALPHEAGPPADASCRLGILLDQSASMNAIRSGSGRTRCEDATLYAATVINFFRCGHTADATGTCRNGTTANLAVDFSMRDASPEASDYDSVYNNPSFECDNASAKFVNVWRFNGATGLRNVTLGITSDPQGWVNLSDNSNADTVLERLRGLATTCAGDTPLADALCGVRDFSPACFSPSLGPSAKLVLLTDGNENASTGQCSGPDDSTGGPLFDPLDSWQANTYTWLGGCPQDGWDIDTALFLPSNGASTVDLEGQSTPPSKGIHFFLALDTRTYGNLTQLTDDAPLSPLISH